MSEETIILFLSLIIWFPLNKLFDVNSKYWFKLINQFIVFNLRLIEYKEPNELRKNKLSSLIEKLLTNWLVTLVSSVGIDLIISPLFLFKKNILFLWLSEITIFL